MGWNFRRSSKVGPFRFTFSKRGVSTSFGSKFFRVTKGRLGTTVSSTIIPGLNYRERIKDTDSAETSDVSPDAAIATPQKSGAMKVVFWIVVVFVLLYAFVR